jgi:hypothetical protein
LGSLLCGGVVVGARILIERLVAVDAAKSPCHRCVVDGDSCRENPYRFSTVGGDVYRRLCLLR